MQRFARSLVDTLKWSAGTAKRHSALQRSRDQVIITQCSASFLSTELLRLRFMIAFLLFSLWHVHMYAALFSVKLPPVSDRPCC